MTLQRVVIVGASLAGATTALTLRQQGFSGSIHLVGDEPHLPYERPALSKGYLSGDVTRDALLIQAPADYRDQEVELVLGTRATGVDTDRRQVTVADGDALPYEALVIATGSTNIRPPIPGMTLPGVHQLRTLDDADQLARAATAARTVVIVGMGFVGCEVAATLRGHGLEVTMVDRLPGPLSTQVGPEISLRVRQWHEQHGVELVTGTDVTALEGGATVERVLLADGRSLPADLVLVGVGARPATDWLAQVPVHLVRGAVGVDAAGRSSASDVYAAGDVAAVWSDTTRTHRREEHYRSAIDQGTRVAHALLDLPLPAARPSWFWSDQYDHVLHYAGDRDGAQLHEREDPYTAFFTRSGTVTGVAALDNGRDFRRALRLIGSTVDPAVLTDPRVDLRRIPPLSTTSATAAG